jgi:chondroitin sulfate proteoglycan 4
VSFYGDGYLRVAAQDAKSDTDLLIEFRTSQSSALLFLAAGATDYCVVTLQSGAVRARIDLGSGDATLQTPPGLVFNDFQWHTVRVIRRQAAVTLSVDDLYAVSATTPGRFFEVRQSTR